MKNLNEFIRRVQLPEVKLHDETRATMVAELERLRDDAEYRERCGFKDHNWFDRLVVWGRSENGSAASDAFFALELCHLDIIKPEPPTLAETIAAVEASGNLKDVDPDDVYGIRGDDRTAKLEAAVKVALEALEIYANATSWNPMLPRISDLCREWSAFGEDGYAVARKALAKVEDLLK